jgi:hypothetical protein
MIEHIPQSKRRKYYNSNPQLPNLHAQMKLHKTPPSIKPIVNWCSSLAYKLAIYLTKILKQNL